MGAAKEMELVPESIVFACQFLEPLKANVATASQIELCHPFAQGRVESRVGCGQFHGNILFRVSYQSSYIPPLSLHKAFSQ